MVTTVFGLEKRVFASGATAARPGVRATKRLTTSSGSRRVPLRSNSAAHFWRAHRHLEAIGYALAAERYGGRVLRAGVQDEHDNLTRFFLIAANPEERHARGRACLALSLCHEPGSLHRALGVLAKCEVNLRSLIARPNRKTLSNTYST